MVPDEMPNGPTPPRDEVVPDHYAIRVTDEWLQVWQYRDRGLDPGGEWHHVQTLLPDEDTRLSVEWARPESPTDDGYWVYCRSYECQRGCDREDEATDASFPARRPR